MAGLSFSGAARWMNCTGSKTMNQQAIRLPSSTEQLEGVKAHEVAAQLLQGLTLDEASDFKSDAQRDDMLRYGRQWVETVKLLSHVYDGIEMHVEKRWVHPENRQVRGDADVTIDARDLVVVGDYKYGEGTPVAAEDNHQLMSTAITRIRTLKREVSGAVGFIHQPRSVFGDKFTSHYWSMQELGAFEERMLAAALESDTPSAKLNPGPWCKMCNARTICPKFVNDIITPLAEAPPLTALSLVAMGELMEKAALAQSFADDLKAYFKNALKREAVAGWALKQRSGARYWDDPMLAKLELEKLIGEKAFKKTLLSPTQVLAEYGELAETLSPYIKTPTQDVLIRTK